MVGFTKENWDIPQPVFIEGMFDEDKDGDIIYNITFTVVTEYSMGNFIQNDPAFTRMHWRYPTQSIEIVNIDTYGALRHGVEWNSTHYVAMHSGISNGGNGDLMLRSRLNVTLANQSNAFTTEAGHVAELRARLDRFSFGTEEDDGCSRANFDEPEAHDTVLASDFLCIAN